MQLNPRPKGLSAKEYLVMQHLAIGMRYLDIARQEKVSINTIQTYIKRAYAKLNVRTRREAVYQTQMLGATTRHATAPVHSHV